jgi:hypothetical protein
MKRENLEIKKENKISENFFSNKNNRENTMNIQITYKIGDKEFSTIEESQKYLLQEIYNRGLEYICENPKEFLDIFNSVTKKNFVNPEKREYSNISQPNMKSIQNLVKSQFSITRNIQEWPVYKFQSIQNPENFFVIRNTKKIFELFYEIQENLENLENFFSKYSYKEKINIWKEV